MVVRRSSSVAAQARAAARERRMDVLAARREREQRIGELADRHAVAVALAAEIRAKAERDAAVQLAEADVCVAELLSLGEHTDEVALLLDLTVSEVRAARRRTRAGGDGMPELGGAGGDAGSGTIPVQAAGEPTSAAPVAT